MSKKQMAFLLLTFYDTEQNVFSITVANDSFPAFEFQNLKFIYIFDSFAFNSVGFYYY